MFQTRGSIFVVSRPRYSTNFFGPLSEIAEKRLTVVDVSVNGKDCLCILPDENGLIDVDARDIHHYDLIGGSNG